jgi:ribosome-associated translation inhibitor RaiA
MGELDFHLEFRSEVEPLEDALLAEADRRLRALTKGHDDMVGASVAVEELTGAETPHRYEARVVAFIKPENIVGVEKEDNVATAVKGALNAVERQVRAHRDKVRKQWQQPPRTPGPIEPE